MKNFFEKLGLFAAITMPLWNIPQVVKIMRRKSCGDISLLWLFGVWGSILAMLPSALTSPDVVLVAFGISNALLFSLVVVVVLRYWKSPARSGNEPAR